MKVLILTADYPRPDGTHERMFVHVRDMYYAKNGIDVTVLNFASSYDYEMDGIRVISLATYRKENVVYDAAVSHASNIRNNYRFLKKYDKKFRRLYFFFHGHEILYLNEAYPAPYPYIRHRRLRSGIFQDMYDKFKISLWRSYYGSHASKASFIFVSNWIKKQFEKNTGLTDDKLMHHCHIINNSIGKSFENGSYDINKEKKYDFITIRSNLDGSKYGVDLVVRLAELNPDHRFLLIGRGKYFEHNKKPDNMEWIGRTMDHNEMFSYLDMSKCALLLTREDTQGVMTCELAAYGMPVITSDIEVCHEFFEEMPNVAMIDNDVESIDISAVSGQLRKGLPYPKNRKYFGENTISEEVRLIKNELL